MFLSGIVQERGERSARGEVFRAARKACECDVAQVIIQTLCTRFRVWYDADANAGGVARRGRLLNAKQGLIRRTRRIAD